MITKQVDEMAPDSPISRTCGLTKPNARELETLRARNRRYSEREILKIHDLLPSQQSGRVSRASCCVCVVWYEPGRNRTFNQQIKSRNSAFLGNTHNPSVNQLKSLFA